MHKEPFITLCYRIPINNSLIDFSAITCETFWCFTGKCSSPLSQHRFQQSKGSQGVCSFTLVNQYSISCLYFLVGMWGKLFNQFIASGCCDLNFMNTLKCKIDLIPDSSIMLKSCYDFVIQFLLLVKAN